MNNMFFEDTTKVWNLSLKKKKAHLQRKYLTVWFLSTGAICLLCISLIWFQNSLANDFNKVALIHVFMTRQIKAVFRNCLNRRMCQDAIISSVVADYHSIAQLLRVPTGGLWIRTGREVTMARRHLENLWGLLESLGLGKVTLLMYRALWRSVGISSCLHEAIPPRQWWKQRSSPAKIILLMDMGAWFPSNML